MSKTKKDTALKEFWRNDERFADLFNSVFFDGKQVLKPEDMEERDADLSSVIFSKETEESLEKYRDVVKYAKGMNFMILGIENQDKIHYAMPLRCRVYDDLQYVKQVKKLGEQHKQRNDWKGFSQDEFLSKMKKEDRIIPCLTIVIYYGEKEWDGPRSLSDMMDIPEEISHYFQDYKIHLLCVHDEDGSSFSQKDVKDLFYVLNRLYHDKESEIYDKNLSVDADTYRAITVVQNNKKWLKNICKETEEVPMCSALERIWENGKKEGIKEGEASGWQAALEEYVGNTLEILSREQIAQIFKISPEMVSEIATKKQMTV